MAGYVLTMTSSVTIKHVQGREEHWVHFLATYRSYEPLNSFKAKTLHHKLLLQPDAEQCSYTVEYVLVHVWVGVNEEREGERDRVSE